MNNKEKIKRIYEIIDEMYSDKYIENICQMDFEDVNREKGVFKRKARRVLLSK